MSCVILGIGMELLRQIVCSSFPLLFRFIGVMRPTYTLNKEI